MKQAYERARMGTGIFFSVHLSVWIEVQFEFGDDIADDAGDGTERLKNHRLRRYLLQHWYRFDVFGLLLFFKATIKLWGKEKKHNFDNTRKLHNNLNLIKWNHNYPLLKGNIGHETHPLFDNTSIIGLYLTSQLSSAQLSYPVALRIPNIRVEEGSMWAEVYRMWQQM